MNTVEALLTDTLVSGQLYWRPPLQSPVFPNSHTNFVFEQSRNRSDPVTDTFFACRGCPLTRAYTVAASVSHGRLWISTLMKVDSTASSVAALSNAGVAVSSAMWVDVVGGDTLVFSFLLVLSHLICLLSQWHIKFLKPLVHSCSTICAVRRCGFPSLRVYLQRFEVSLETSSNLWCARGASSLRQLSLKELLWYSVIVHLDNMTKPAHSPLL